MSHHRCICNFPACRADGGEATLRLPQEDPARGVWLSKLCPDNNECIRKDPRVSISHFSQNSIVASNVGHGPGGASVSVRLTEGALPTVTNDDMVRAAKGSLGRSLRYKAVLERHAEALVVATSEVCKLKAEVARLQADAVEMAERLKVSAKRKEEPSRLRGIDDSFLIDKKEEAVKCMTGLISHQQLTDLYEALNDDGAAANMNFYGGGPESAVKKDGSRVVKRKKVFRGPNGLFFTLFILRTATPITVASALFGRDETTGGRAFSTWLNFLARSLRHFVRLPKPDEVAKTAPANFVSSNLADVIFVLDATEVEVERVWNKDAAYVLYSSYKGKPTGKLLIAITPSGMICYISGVYGGRLSDAELVRQSGVLDELRSEGFTGSGFHVMADRGFNSIAPLLMQDEIHFVAPPWERRGEEQFTQIDANLTQEIANRRIHVERAIGAMKKWRILDSKFSSKQFDHMGMCFQTIGALVNMLQQPFCS